MAMSATVAVVGNAIVNKPVTVVATLSNSGASAVNVSSVQPRLTPGGHTSIISPVFVPVNQAVVSTTGMQQTIQVGAGGSAVVTFQVICPSPVIQSGRPQQGGPSYQVTVDCATDDGLTVFSALPVPIPFAGVQFGAPELNPNAPSGSVGGELQFNSGQNSALAL
jgi:hypothetical protein